MNANPPPAPALDYSFSIAIELVPVKWVAPTAFGRAAARARRG